MKHKIIIAGASGLVGKALLEQTLQHPDIIEVVVLVRKQLAIVHPKMRQLVVDFNSLENYESQIYGDAIFCCLGTTRRKTPDLNLFRVIDHDYPLNLAMIAIRNSINQYHFISSLGADIASKGFYTKLKGETEAELKKMPLPALFIYQPSLLTGSRDDLRLDNLLGGPIMKLINPFLKGKFKKYKSISAKIVASAMLNRFLFGNKGVSVFPSDKIRDFARKDF